MTMNDKRLAALNNTPGQLTGYECSICNNKGIYFFIGDDGEEYSRPCACVPMRQSLKLANSTGILDRLKQNKFSTFKTKEVWQKNIKDIAGEYCEEPDGSFFIGGQVGAGKTHICTAITGRLIKAYHIPMRYMLWQAESKRLKAIVTDSRYDTEIKPYATVDGLYIDDFLKGGRTQGDINLAFEIINARYNRGLRTIISSELTLPDIIRLDEALGSRVQEMCGKYVITIDNDFKKNQRLHSQISMVAV